MHPAQQQLLQIMLSHVAASAYTTLLNTSINNFGLLVVTPFVEPFYSKLPPPYTLSCI